MTGVVIDIAALVGFWAVIFPDLIALVGRRPGDIGLYRAVTDGAVLIIIIGRLFVVLFVFNVFATRFLGVGVRG